MVWLESLTNLMVLYSRSSIIIFAFVVTLIMTYVTKKVTNQDRMKELKEIQKKCKLDLKEHKDNPEKVKEINRQIMECSMELMKHSFKPMFYTIIPLLIFFWWIRGIYAGVLSGWIWWYIGGGIISSIVLRKVMNVV